MPSKRSAEAGENGDNHRNYNCVPLRTSDRVRKRPKVYGRAFLYYNGSSLIRPMRPKKKKRKQQAASIAKMLSPGGRPAHRKPNGADLDAATNLRRSTRKRRAAVNLDDYTDSSGTDEDLMKPGKYRTRARFSGTSRHSQISSPKHKKLSVSRSAPRREGLRPRGSKADISARLSLEFDDEEGSSGEKDDQDETENGNDVDEGEGDDEDEGEREDEDEGEREDEDEEGRENDGDEEDGDDEDGEEEQDGRRRYDLRNRSEVRRFSHEENKQRPRSPRRVLRQGMGTRLNRDVRKGSSKVHKRHRFTRVEDSDDSLLVDELDQGPAIPWGRGGARSGPPWLLGGVDVTGATSWGLNVAASGWGHQNDACSSLISGAQTAGPSSKGGADIQPVQVDDSVSFNDIGGLSEYIDALKEMIFFPLLYPEFFSSYNITPPRGVLLCGPPGTGKTLVARALACAASKAGQKVSFYMRKGADVLSKWVGEAERQLKLLFEEAQRNQPSIIFFDEIDGLAPVRSSKQEQIHNSIVSTLLALMDGLDSRGQVVLIGATNRIDAIDGALRRPGRFDREFSFSLPGCEARGEILDIHTRKWKHPPPEELKMELAASCVGYCGADLKALCTEAAIRAFREKYPQVYTSDDKFLIDVDSVKVEKSHFVDAMLAITPASRRGSIVHSRPLSSVVAPCLRRHLLKAMESISDIFPVQSSSTELTKLSLLSYGSSIPLVYRPRFLLCGDEDVGLDHLGPAILHELEKFPVHSLGLPSLLSDPSAKTPEEALVHIFCEARRTTPSILYLPNYDKWWESAHEQLRNVLQNLLEELPSDFPILFFGTSSTPCFHSDAEPLIFPHHSIYILKKPMSEDRSLFFDCLVETVLSISGETEKRYQHPESSPNLPKAPKVDSGPKASELKAKVEAEQHALRRMRMCLRDVCNRILYDKRFSAFHFPVMDEDAPNYHKIIQNPMDMATVLQHVDAGRYITCSAFLQDVDLILSNAKVYNGDDYNGARIVSRAHELRDAVHGMLAQMDPALVTFCDKIASQGGPTQLPCDSGVSSFPLLPVVQMANTTRASARLRNVQPEVNLDQSYQALKRPKKNIDPSHGGSLPEEKLQLAPEPKPLQETESPTVQAGSECSPAGNDPQEVSMGECEDTIQEDVVAAAPDADVDTTSQVEAVKRRFLEKTENYGIAQLEMLYTRVIRGVLKNTTIEGGNAKNAMLQFLLEFSNF